MAEVTTRETETTALNKDGKPLASPEAEKSLFNAFEAVSEGRDPMVIPVKTKEPEDDIEDDIEATSKDDESLLADEEKENLDSVFGDTDDNVRSFMDDLQKNDSNGIQEEETEEEVVEESEQPEEDEQPDEDEQPEESSEEDDQEEIDEIVNNPHTKEKTRKRIQKLLKEKAELKDQLEEAQKLAEASSENPEELQALQEELTATRQQLSVYMRRYDLENDPELKEKYDSKLTVAKTTIVDILKENGLPEKSEIKERENEDTGEIEKYRTVGIDAIEEAGGFVEYAIKNPSVYKTILDTLDPMDADIIRTKVAEYRSVQQAKKIEIEKLSQETEGYFESQQKAYQEQVEEITKIKEATKQDAIKKFGFLQKVAIPDSATADERAKAKAQNQKAEGYLAKLDFALNPQTAQDSMDVALAAVYAYNLADELRQSQATIKALEERIKKIKSATPSKSRSSIPRPSSNQQRQSKRSDAPRSFDEALNFVAS